MTRREQLIETVIREFLRARGAQVFQDGDVYADLATVGLGLAEGGDAHKEINITELAREIERVF